MLAGTRREAAQTAVRLDPEFRKEYQHRCHQKPKAVAKVAGTRKLAVRLYWMLRRKQAYPEVVRIESSPRVPLVGEKLDREVDWALSHAARGGMFAWKNHGRCCGRIDGWWNDWFRRKMIQREISRALVLNLSGKRSGAAALHRISLSLTAPSLLSRGTLTLTRSGPPLVVIIGIRDGMGWARSSSG